MRRILFVTSALLLLTAYTSSSWPKDIRKVYMKACVDSASKDMSKKLAKKYCLCTLEKIEVLYPDPTTVSSIPEDVIIRVANECVTK